MPAHRPLIDRFFDFVSPEPNSGCWLWIGCISHNGYGRLRNGKTAAAHRISYQLYVGEIPAGLEIDHLCRVRSCVNPDHLEPVTRKENCRRGLGGQNNALKTHCPQGHPYTKENTLKYRGSRTCRACNKKRCSDYDRRRKGRRT